MIRQNFTQYAIANGYPSDYDVLDHGDLGASGHVSKIQRKASQDRQAGRARDNRAAHIKYDEDILAGRVIDPSGEVTKEDLLAREQILETAIIQGKRKGLKSQIAWIEGLGIMSHRENGTLRPSYQRTVDLYRAELANL